MVIRKATPEDIPAIVQLLKASLGDVSSTKSVAYWNWKHVNNPFGSSPVLVAEENGTLIGVRAFMRWDWIEGATLYRALRAVDTATHPAHQGKGIFRKLTMQMVDEATREGFDFIFNSPNAQSTPGYLKMGWEVWGRMSIWIRVRLFPAVYKESYFLDCHQKLINFDFNVIKNEHFASGLHTPVTGGFLAWRYRDCPVKKYALHEQGAAGDRLWIFFTAKQNKFGMELRVCHFVFEGATRKDRLIREAVALSRKIGCRFVTFSGLQDAGWFLKLRYGILSLKSGSVQLTIRKLANEGLYKELINMKNWFPETGDIELF